MESRVLIVDDDVILTRAWSRLLRARSFAVEVANSVSDASTRLRDRLFQVVLVDLALPDGSGESLLPSLAGLCPKPAVAVVSGFLENRRIVDLYGKCTIALVKPLEGTTLVDLVKTLAAKAASGDNVNEFCRQYSLSPRESEVVRAAASGLQNKQIAEVVRCAPSTVVTYWQRIFRKLGCRRRSEVLAMILRSKSDGRI